MSEAGGAEAEAAEIDVFAEEDAGPVDAGVLVAVEDLVRFALRREGASGAWTIAVVLVSDARLQALHRDFMGIDEPTDVMTFPTGDEGGDGGRGGDIVISLDRAREQGPEHGLTVEDEVAFLAVHGVLHLLGWDDGTADERARMLARGAGIIRAWREG